MKCVATYKPWQACHASGKSLESILRTSSRAAPDQHYFQSAAFERHTGNQFSPSKPI